MAPVLRDHDSARVISVIQHGADGGNAVAEKRIEFAYDDEGRIISIDRYQDDRLAVEADYTYDDCDRLVSPLYHQGGTPLASYAWTYTGSGEPLLLATASNTDWSPNGGLPSEFVDQGMLPVHDTDGVVDALMVGGCAELSRLVSCTSLDGTVTYSYDPTGQLIAADYSDESIADESYTYDASGNRVTANGYVYTTGEDNRLLSDGTYWYDYDPEGNRVARYIDVNVNGILDSGDTDVTEYVWDARNRLVRVADYPVDGAPPEQVVDYVYDLENRWIGSLVDSDGDGTVDQRTAFAYDGNQIVLQFEDDDLSHRYLWQPDAVDQLMADEQIEMDDVVWALTDHLGTIRDLALADPDTGETSVANHITYDSFGNKTSETTAVVDCLFGFTGRPFDETTGLQNNLNRWYDGRVGAWISNDPIGFKGYDTNVYRYCGNGPTDRLDSTGAAWWNLYIFDASAWLGTKVHAGWAWIRSRAPVENELRDDGTSEVTINEGCTIVILFGHGSHENPHSFNFNAPLTYGGFVGCWASRTNNDIPEEHVIPGLGEIRGQLSNRKSNNSLDACGLICKQAKELAYDLIRDLGVKQVTIVAVKAGGWTDPKDWAIPVTGILDGKDKLIITAADLPENQ